MPQLCLIPGFIALAVWQLEAFISSLKFLDDPFTTVHLSASILCFAASMLCLMFALSQLIPQKKPADAGYIVRLLRRDPMAVDVFCRLLWMNEATVRGQRLRDCDGKTAAKLVTRWAKVAPRVLFSGELACERELMEMIDAAVERINAI